MIDRLSWVVIYPELILLVMTCAIILLDLFVKSKGRDVTHFMTVATLSGLAMFLAFTAQTGQRLLGWSGMVISDPLSNWLQCFACISVLVTLVYGKTYAQARGMLRGGELFGLSLFALLGIFIMISAHHLLMVYLGLEMLTLSSYALVALRRDDGRSTEASMKYFVLGALASGFLLYGFSLIYGATGSLDLAVIAKSMASPVVSHAILILGVIFVVAALAFKLGLVPFHMWIPDVYHGAPSAVTLLIAGAPKLAAFAVLIRVLVEGLLPLSVEWQQMMVVLSVGSLLIGNLAAIAQTNVKRMLAFSTIGQMGFLLLALVAASLTHSTLDLKAAYESGMFYVVSYVLTTLASFGVILMLSRKGFESDELADFAGLGKRNPMLAMVMAACMFSLAGIPPFVGFYAKLTVLKALMLSGQAFFIGLAVFAVLMSLIATFYYLRVVKVMFFDEPTQLASLEASPQAMGLLMVNGMALLLLGLFPSGLLQVCRNAMASIVF